MNVTNKQFERLRRMRRTCVGFIIALAATLPQLTFAAAPLVDNATGAVEVRSISATLSGTLTSTGGLDTEVRVYWGEEDGEATFGDWEHVAALGSLAAGSVEHDLTGLIPERTYFYRFFATNVDGDSWANPSVSFQTLSSDGPAPINLGTTANFTILAGAGITTTGGGMINGDVGASPIAGSAIGIPSSQVNGTIYCVDDSGPAGSVRDPDRLTIAKGDLTIAYNEARDRTPVPSGPFLNPQGGNIGGLNLVPGLYKFTGTALITGADVTLTGGPSDVWIFQIAADLQVGSGIKVILAGGAQARNIFWQVGTEAVLDTSSVFKGTILASQSVVMKTGSTMEGRALAFSAGVTFNGTGGDVPEENAAPVAANDAYNMDQDLTVRVLAPGVLDNDTDAQGDPLTAVLVSTVSNGTLVLNPNGSFAYTPTVSFTGDDTFTYKANDGALDSEMATATISVLKVNTAPIAVDDAYAMDENTTLTVLVADGVLDNDSDAHDDPLTAVLVATVSSGILALNTDGSFAYTPTIGFVGDDSFTYKANDGDLDSVVATVTINVRDVNTAPVAIPDVYAVDQDTTLVVAQPGVLANDTDGQSDPLTAVLVATVSNGTLVLDANGSFAYTPTIGFTGEESFTYKANDGAVDSNVVTVTIAVGGVNTAPVAVEDSYTMDQDTTLVVALPGVLANDLDAQSDPLTAVLVATVSNGTLVLDADGSFAYTPTVSFTGDDSFTYKANDGDLDSNVITVTIAVGGVNSAPTAVADAYTMVQDTTLVVALPGVLVNDTDAQSDALTAVLVATVSNGTLVLDANGSFAYTPTIGFTGDDSFTYKANDGNLDSNVVTVTITVNGGIDDGSTILVYNLSVRGYVYTDGGPFAVESRGPGLLVIDYAQTRASMLYILYVPGRGYISVRDDWHLQDLLITTPEDGSSLGAEAISSLHRELTDNTLTEFAVRALAGVKTGTYDIGGGQTMTLANAHSGYSFVGDGNDSTAARVDFYTRINGVETRRINDGGMTHDQAMAYYAQRLNIVESGTIFGLIEPYLVPGDAAASVRAPQVMVYEMASREAVHGEGFQITRSVYGHLIIDVANGDVYLLERWREIIEGVEYLVYTREQLSDPNNIVANPIDTTIQQWIVISSGSYDDQFHGQLDIRHLSGHPVKNVNIGGGHIIDVPLRLGGKSAHNYNDIDNFYDRFRYALIAGNVSPTLTRDANDNSRGASETADIIEQMILDAGFTSFRD